MAEAISPTKTNDISKSLALLYKCKTTQKSRREKFLEEIKLRRNETVDKNRDFSFNNDDLQEEEEEPMDVTSNYKRKVYKKAFKNKLMLSEWFTEIPDDLERKWFIKLCPKGTRNLIVAHKKSTIAYNRKGDFKSKFNSNLPGGGPQSINYNTYTILDSIFNHKLCCFYILDVIAWNGKFLKLCDTDFRFYWLKSKFLDMPELKEKSRFNDHPLLDINYLPAELPLIEDSLSSPYMINDEHLELDGILFYHRDTDYIESTTPLVGWLKPFMVPEMLHIPIAESFMQKVPSNYTSMIEYLHSSYKYKNKGRNDDKCVDKDIMDVAIVN